MSAIVSVVADRFTIPPVVTLSIVLPVSVHVVAARNERWQDEARALAASAQAIPPVPAAVEWGNLHATRRATLAAVEETRSKLSRAGDRVLRDIADGRDPSAAEAEVQSVRARLGALEARFPAIEKSLETKTLERNVQERAAMKEAREKLAAELRERHRRVCERAGLLNIPAAVVDELAALQLAVAMLDRG